MATDFDAWRAVVVGVVGGLADEASQRRSWFGIGTEISSPAEEFNYFFSDAAVDEFVEQAMLDDPTRLAGRYLVKLMRRLSSETPDDIDPALMIDDPRWIEVRMAAADFLKLL